MGDDDMPLHLIISIDYEIFGDGTGNPVKHIIRPAEKMMTIAEKEGSRITFMAEVMEYLVYSQYEDEAQRDFGYSPAKLIEEQMRDAISRGHDVQMHIHPQFWRAKYEKKRIVPVGGRDPRYMNEKETFEMLKEGLGGMKKMLENHSLSVLRLSNMPWMEAPENSIKAMKRLGLRVHSLAVSSSKGNKAPGYWKLGNAVVEIPIFAVPSHGISYFSFRRMLALTYLLMHRGLSSGGDGGERSSKLDICKLNHRMMLSHIEAVGKYAESREDTPVVMIGHTKDFFNSSNFERFLREFRERYVHSGKAVFDTFGGFSEYLVKKGVLS